MATDRIHFAATGLTGPTADAGPAPSPARRPDAGSTGAPARQRRWRSSELFGSAQEVEIEHGDAVYRLRLTSLGKLIMTK